jgi:hypothetical protein
MRAGLARRQVALAAIAVVGALGAIALTRLNGDGGHLGVPTRASAGWRKATVAVLRVEDRPVGCDVRLTAETLGLVHPALPCGARLVLKNAGRRAEAEVVARGPVGGADTFDLTPALAARLGVTGETRIRWRFAG